MKKTNLLIDCAFINDYKYWPVSIALYAGRLLNGFNKNPLFNVCAIVWKGKEAYVDELAGFEVEKLVVDENDKITPWRSLDRLLGLNPLMNRVKKKNIDIVLSPYHFECYYFFPKRFHHYAIVQDMIPYYILEERIGKIKFWLWRIYRKILNRQIYSFISISNNTRKELKKFEGEDSVVIYNSIPFDISVEEVRIPELENKKYILDINRYEKHKNAAVLIYAFSQIQDQIPHLLYLKGDERNPTYRLELEELVFRLGIKDRVIFDKSNRSEGEISYLYKHADLVVSPSLMEGFGWTPIEAAIFKAPVIISDIDVFKEITCGKISTFNPFSPEELSALVVQTIANPKSFEERNKLSEFFLEKYSLNGQLENFSRVLLEKKNERYCNIWSRRFWTRSGLHHSNVK